MVDELRLAGPTPDEEIREAFVQAQRFHTIRLQSLIERAWAHKNGYWTMRRNNRMDLAKMERLLAGDAIAIAKTLRTKLRGAGPEALQ